MVTQHSSRSANALARPRSNFETRESALDLSTWDRIVSDPSNSWLRWNTYSHRLVLSFLPSISKSLRIHLMTKDLILVLFSTKATRICGLKQCRTVCCNSRSVVTISCSLSLKTGALQSDCIMRLYISWIVITPTCFLWRKIVVHSWNAMAGSHKHSPPTSWSYPELSSL